MRRLISALRGAARIALVLLFAGSAVSIAVVAQVRGIPASVTSLRPGDTFATSLGVPASVTSLGPQGFTPAISGTRFASVRFLHQTVFVPVAVPVFVAPEFGAEFIPAERPVMQPVSAPAPSEPRIQIIVLDMRESHKGDGNNDQESVKEQNKEKNAKDRKKTDAQDSTGREDKQSPQPDEANSAASEITPTLFLFRDGSRKELSDYAIMNGDLIDLTGGRARHIALNELDLAATARANNERGVPFHLP